MDDEFVMDLTQDGTPVPIDIAAELMGLTEDEVRDICEVVKICECNSDTCWQDSDGDIHCNREHP